MQTYRVHIDREFVGGGNVAEVRANSAGAAAIEVLDDWPHAEVLRVELGAWVETDDGHGERREWRILQPHQWQPECRQCADPDCTGYPECLHAPEWAANTEPPCRCQGDDCKC